MASKRATAYVVDIGAVTIGPEGAAGAKALLISLLMAAVFVDRANDVLALFFIGSNESFYRGVDEQPEPGYPGLVQLFPQPEDGMGSISTALIKLVHDYPLPTTQPFASDVLGGVVYAADAIDHYCTHYKYEKRIVLITSPRCTIDDVLYEPVIFDRCADKGITVDVLALHAKKSEPTAGNTQWLQSIATNTGGKFKYTDAMAAAALASGITLFKQAPSRPYGNMDLCLGDPATILGDDACVRIHIQFCMGVDKLTVPSLKKLSRPALEAVAGSTAGGPGADGADGFDDATQDWDDLGGAAVPPPLASTATTSGISKQILDSAKVIEDSKFRVILDNGELDMTDVHEKDETVNAYPYGGVMLPVGDWEAEKEGSGLDAGITILGFTSLDSIPRQALLSASRYVIPNSKAPGAEIHFTALVCHLVQQRAAAIARYVYRRDFTPRLYALFPVAGRAALTCAELASSADMRTVAAMSLDMREYFDDAGNRRPTASIPGALALDASGAPVPAHIRWATAQKMLPERLVPSNEQRMAAARLVAEFDLDAVEAASGGAAEEEEDVTPLQPYHPWMQIFSKAVRDAIVHPLPISESGSSTLPPPPPATGVGASQSLPAPSDKGPAAATVGPLLDGFRPLPEVWETPAALEALEYIQARFATNKVVKAPPKRKRGIDTTATTAAAAGGDDPGDKGADGDDDALAGDAPAIKRHAAAASQGAGAAIHPARWRTEFEDMINSTDDDRVAEALTALMAVARGFAEAGDNAQARECMSAAVDGAARSGGEKELQVLVSEERARGGRLAAHLPAVLM
ncbi:hypothetical protein BC828DRAFT_407255 [Blastocladiella britannica]|nr:hypothetical protein BC828DRAFT_407255 [Blastocladiella britannica]